MKKQIILIIIALLLPAASLQAAISSVTLTPAPPTTLSNGNSYYLAGRQYTFRVQAVDTAATGKADWTSIQLTFPSGETMTINVNAPPAAGTTVGSVFVFDLLTDATSVYTNVDFRITLRFRWDSVEYAPAGNTVTATVVNVNSPGGVPGSSTFLFGKCSTIRVVNFAQSGVASDGYVNPWHTDFFITGTVTYNITGATVADAVETMSGDINSISLYDVATDTTLPNNGNNTTFNYRIHWGPIAPPQIYALSLGNHTWNVRPVMATPGYTYVAGPTNSIALVCDQIRIDTITIINGGGTLLPPYYRSVNISGTQVQITASRQSGAPGALPMVGNTTITVRNITDSQDFTLQITNGAISGTGNVPFPSALPAPGSTLPKTYQIVKITGSAFDNEQDLDIPANAGCITQTPANPVIYWDRNDPPGDNNAPGVGETPFTGGIGVSPTTGGFSLTWTALNPSSAIPPFDGDFYTYRIYYKLASSSTWTIVDRSTLGYGLGGTYRLDLIGTSSAQITGLQPLTNYNYFITAVDVFGQEVEYTSGTSDAAYVGAPVGDYGTVLTAATSISVKITDGVTEYPDSTHQFEIAGPINAINRPLRKSSLRVTLFIVATSQPDSVNIILARDDGAGNGIPAGDLVTVTNVLVSQAIINWERISCSKSAPNTWQCYIPSNNQFLVEGQFCRFIIESIKGGIPTYSDALLEVSPPGEANTYEFTFMVQTPTTFQPWPTRVLNNVLTERNPVCYPSYYLSADAYVTIKAYDVKGRPVATLIDNGFRKGGQNIKEGGWAGDNKSRRKLGVGLYYLRFEAKRASDGKVILNQTEKVVVAK